MKLAPSGFAIASICLTGPGKQPASLTFTDGLNVVSGASDSGKSYALGCIDFAFGARRLTRTIPQADGYKYVVMSVRARRTGHTFEFKRALAGGDVLLREFNTKGSQCGEQVLAARHDAKDPATLSGTLLDLSDLGGKRVRKNKQGDVRSLSFRDVAYLALVDEERIISERPPHISGSPVEKTVETSTLRLLATGHEADAVVSPLPKGGDSALRAQITLVRSLEAQAAQELGGLGLAEPDVESEMASIEAERHSALSSYEATRVELLAAEDRIATAARNLRETDARTIVVEGLHKRFDLLRRHYESDLLRLEAVAEAGTLLGSLAPRNCPLCGAAPTEHRDPDDTSPFNTDDLRSAAKSESIKVASLRSDLLRVLEELSEELVELEARRDQLRSLVRELQAKVTDELQPRSRASAEALRNQTDRRDLLLRARSIIEQRTSLSSRAKDLELQGQRRGPKPLLEAAPTTADLEAFSTAVQSLLRDWNYPDAGRVVFSETDQDLVIGGQPRGSHGKGVRALSCAAFIIGLMRHCTSRGLPHPGVVLLDSPLVVYREPDARSEDLRLRQAGVKDAFYRSLAAGAAGGQVIIFENEDPPDSPKITRHHFSKASTGRYGFIPDPPSDNAPATANAL